eukprot:PITA_22982
MPMEKLLKKDVTFCWNEAYKKILDVLKGKMVTALILVFPDWKKEFHVHVDTSSIALRVVLTQASGGDLDHPIEFTNHLSHIKTGEEPTNLEEGFLDTQLFVVHIMDGHFEDIIHFLMIGTTPEGYTVQQQKELVVWAAKFYVIAKHLYKMGSDEVLCRYVSEFERINILVYTHGHAAGGHYTGRTTT